MEKTGIPAALLIFIVALGASTAVTAQEQSPNKNNLRAPFILLAPPVIAATVGTELAGDCWARLYDAENYLGDVLLLAGPIDVPDARIGETFEWGRKYHSVVVGPKATLTVYDNELYVDRAVTFTSDQRVPNLDEKLGYFENIQSLKLSCTK